MSQENSPELVFQCFSVPKGRDKQIEVWRLVNIDRPMRPIPILLAPGFAQKMSAFAPLAQYLVYNGFEVFRYDPTEHVGLSSGDMLNFTLTSALEDMECMVEWLNLERGLHSVGIIATSLSARCAYRLLSRRPEPKFLVTAVGVTNVRRTLAEVFGQDYSLWAPEELPPTLAFEDHHEVKTRPFQADCVAEHWWDSEETAEELSASTVPVIAFIGNDDTWVTESDVRDAFSRSLEGRRKIYKLQDVGHELTKNPRVARYLFQELTKASIMLTEDLESMPTILEYEPGFSELSVRVITERRFYQPTEMPQVAKSA